MDHTRKSLFGYWWYWRPVDALQIFKNKGSITSYEEHLIFSVAMVMLSISQQSISSISNEKQESYNDTIIFFGNIKTWHGWTFLDVNNWVPIRSSTWVHILCPWDWRDSWLWLLWCTVFTLLQISCTIHHSDHCMYRVCLIHNAIAHQCSRCRIGYGGCDGHMPMVLPFTSLQPFASPLFNKLNFYCSNEVLVSWE